MGELNVGDVVIIPFKIISVNAFDLIGQGTYYEMKFENRGFSFGLTNIHQDYIEGLQIERFSKFHESLVSCGFKQVNIDSPVDQVIDKGVEPGDSRLNLFANKPTRNEVEPLDIQVGGDHYKSMKIQPIEFCMENELDACQSAAIKYICRYKEKNGVEDLEKAKHYLDMLIDRMEKECV